MTRYFYGILAVAAALSAISAADAATVSAVSSNSIALDASVVEKISLDAERPLSAFSSYPPGFYIIIR